MKGTPNFLAPEIYFGKESYTKSVDLYSLGIVLYRLLNYNRNPFMPQFPEQFYVNDEDIAFEKRMSGEEPNLPSLGGENIGLVITKAISSRDNRFQTASDFLYALENAAKNTANEILSKKIKYTIFNTSDNFNRNYSDTFVETSSSRNIDAKDVSSNKNSVNQHLFDTLRESNELQTNNSSESVVDVSSLKSQVNSVSAESQFRPDNIQESDSISNQQKRGSILKKIFLFLLPLFVLSVVAVGYFFVLPKISSNTLSTSNERQDDITSTLKEAGKDKLDDLKKLTDDVTKGIRPYVYLGKDLKAYSNGLYYKEYDDTSSFNMGGAPYKRGFLIGTYKDGGYANFNLGGNYNYIAGVAGCIDGVYCTVTYNILADNQLIGTIEVKKGFSPTEFEFEVAGIKQLSIIATGKGNHGEGVGFGNVALYNEKSDKPELYEINDLPKTAYLGVDIKSYVSGLYYEEYDGTNTFNMGGEKYSKGFTIGTYTDGGFASFNIEGKYTSISGVAGNVDKVNHTVTYNVLGDGQSIGNIDIKGGGLPTEFNFDVTGIKQINIIAMGKGNHGKGVGFANVVLK